MGNVTSTLMSQLSSQAGGLNGLVSKLSSNGLGQQVQSWIGHGENQPVNADQIKQALGDDHIQQLAQQAGTTPDEAASHLAANLPDAVHRLTPDGVVPDLESLKSRVGNLFSRH